MKPALEKKIVYCGQDAVVGCDAACNKAWGIVCRPCVYLDAQGKVVYVMLDVRQRRLQGIDYDNYAYIPDHLLGEAPADPGTYEGADGKSPKSLNKWCVRQCERCDISSPGTKEVNVSDFSDYVFNMPSIKKIVETNPGWRDEFAAAIEQQKTRDSI